MKRVVLFCMLLIAVLMLVKNTQATNPFIGKGGTQKEAVVQKQVRVNHQIQPIVSFSQKYQKVFKQKLTGFAKAMKEKPFGKAFWLFLWFSFLYGIFHALGPGHGKSIAISYFLSRPGKIIHGLLMGNLLTFSHVFSAVATIMVLYFVLKISGLSAFDQFSGHIKILSALLLIGVGIYLMVHAIDEYKNRSFDEVKSDEQSPDTKSLLMTSVVTGLIPCPGAAIILSYAMISGIMLQGLLAMVAISLGMGLTTSAIALATILSRQTFLKLAAKNSGYFKLIYTLVSCAGAGLIVIIALMMLIGSVYGTGLIF